MKRASLFFIIIMLFFSCKQDKKINISSKELTAQEIVNNAIEISCNGNCNHVSISFTFRDKQYKSLRNGGFFQLERFKTDSLDVIHDVLTNEGLKRYINDSLISVPDSTALKISEGVNSVHYFVQLPYGLNAPAVQKRILGEDIINGTTYYEIEVTFSKEGGGIDFEDRFVYWIHKENFTVDFLAYRYATNGGGLRFREAYNIREIEGIRFVDYNNYRPISLDLKLEDLDELFEKGQLELLSKIETEDVVVEILK